MGGWVGGGITLEMSQRYTVIIDTRTASGNTVSRTSSAAIKLLVLGSATYSAPADCYDA
jgi:hypothetical protein